MENGKPTMDILMENGFMQEACLKEDQITVKMQDI